jgi:hypothetical protein
MVIPPKAKGKMKFELVLPSFLVPMTGGGGEGKFGR